MVICQVKFGSVIHNVKQDLYARVLGLVDIDGIIRIQIHRQDPPEKPDPDWRIRTNPTFMFWNVEDCEPLTEREIDGSLFLGVPPVASADALDREV